MFCSSPVCRKVQLCGLMDMAFIDFKNTIFNSLCGIITCVSGCLGYFASHYSISLSFFFLTISLLSSLTLIGSFLAFRNLEGCVVRYIIQHGGSVKRELLVEYHSNQGSIELILSSLHSRGVVSIESDLVVLNATAIEHGFLNSIMMWASRKQHTQSLEQSD